MRIHKHLVLSVVKALEEIFLEKKYADKVIEKNLFQNKKWGSRDRKFFAESVYEVVRHYRWLATISNELGEFQENDFLVLWSIWYFFKFKEYVPSEIVDLHWGQVEDLLVKKYPRKVRFSLPDWVDERGEKELGPAWDRCAKALSNTASVHLRVNRLKTDPQKLHDLLEQEGISIKTQKEFPDALTLNERKNVFSTKCFKEGLFEVQDLSSQKVAPFLRVEPGHRVIDACAGAGGKSLHLAALMKNKGKIISLDIHQWKLDELKKRARRNGVDIIETRLIEGKTIKRLAESCDRLLLDVPCSGLGVLKRNPDSKWKLSEEELERLLVLQSELLENYTKMLKVNGIIVYATCSLLPSENEKQVENFLKKHPDFELLEQQRLNPDEGDFDGFFMAAMKKLPTASK